MSNYTDLISRLNKKTGPINLSEIVELLEEQTLPADALGPGTVERVVTEKLQEPYVSVADYGAVAGGDPAVNAAAFQAAINAADGGAVFIPPAPLEYELSASIQNVPGKRLVLRGGNQLASRLRASAGFTGYLINPRFAYDLDRFSITGDATPGQFLIGDNTPGAGAGYASIEHVRLYGGDCGIYFGAEFEHPHGLVYDNIYFQAQQHGGIILGGASGAASSGESSFVLSNVTGSAVNASGIEIAATVQNNVPSATQDTISWSADATALFGYVVVRRPSGSTDDQAWVVPSNWSGIYYTSTSFVASKTNGTTWEYKVLHQTRGVSVRRAKAVNIPVIQADRFGIGLCLDDITAGVVGAVYVEWRNALATPLPNLCAVGCTGFRGTIGGIWAETVAYGILQRDSIVQVGHFRGSAKIAAFARYQTAAGIPSRYAGTVLGSTPAILANPAGNGTDHDYAGDLPESNDPTTNARELLSHTTKATKAVAYRGTVKAWIVADATDGYVAANRVDVDLASKTSCAPQIKNSGQYTILTNNSATNCFSFTAPAGPGSMVLSAHWNVFDNASVPRQSMSQLVTLSYTTVSGTTTAAVAGGTPAKALANGTLTDPTWAISVSGQNVTVTCSVNSSLTGASPRLYLIPLTALGQQPTSVAIA